MDPKSMYCHVSEEMPMDNGMPWRIIPGLGQVLGAPIYKPHSWPELEEPQRTYDFHGY